MFDRAGEGDSAADAVVEQACDYLGRGIAIACATVDPDAVVIGGGVAKAGEAIRERVEKAFQRYCFHACQDTRILLAKLGNDAGIYGCARMAMGIATMAADIDVAQQ